MQLFVGLGNPGNKYENNRHNIGFMAVDEIVRRHNFLPGVGEGKKRWQALTHEGNLGGQKIVLIKPQTFMNESGRAVGEAMRFYKLTSADVVVLYDELDVAFGKVKAKVGGGAAGHNGIRSIASHIGPDFLRVRLGIGHPGEKSRVHGHVLGDFAKSERDGLQDILDAVAAEAEFLANRDTPRFLTEVARRLNPQRPATGSKTEKKTSRSDTKPKAPAPEPAEEASGWTAALQSIKDKFKGNV